MALQLITAATEQTVTMDEARTACRIAADEARFDDLLTLLLAGAVQEIESFTGRALAPQGWRLTLDEFSEAIELAEGPVSAVSAVKYYDVDGVQQTVEPALYTLDLVSSPQWVVLNEGESWPEVLDAVNAVSVDFTAGYTAASLPAQLKGAVLGLVQHRFDNGMAAEMPDGVRQAAHAFRRMII